MNDHEGLRIQELAASLGLPTNGDWAQMEGSRTLNELAEDAGVCPDYISVHIEARVTRDGLGLRLVTTWDTGYGPAITPRLPNPRIEIPQLPLLESTITAIMTAPLSPEMRGALIRAAIEGSIR